MKRAALFFALCWAAAAWGVAPHVRAQAGLPISAAPSDDVPAAPPAAEQAAPATDVSAPAAPAPAAPAPAAVAAPVESPPPESRAHESLAATGDPFADGAGDLAFGVFSLRALLQTRYTATFGFKSLNTRASYVLREEYLVEHDDGFAINRLFLRLGAEPTPYLGFKALFDFAELIDDHADSMVKQAYAVLRPVPDRFEIATGVQKLPYSTLELDASARFELADFGLADSLVKDLGFAGRDVGATLMAAPLSKPRYLVLTAGVFAGHAHGEHDSPLGAIGARVETKPLKSLRFGADFVAQPQGVTYLRPFETSGKDVLPEPPDPLYPRQQQWSKGWAWSADARFERKRLMLRAEVMAGDRVDVFTRYGAETFGAVWALAAYRFRLGAVELMPAARAEWLDADRQHATGLYRELSVGVTMLYPDHVRLLFDLTRTDVQAHSPLLDQPKPLTDPPYMALDNTRFITQLQIEI